MESVLHEKGKTEQRSFTSLLAACCLVTFGCYFAVSMRLPIMPLYAHSLGISPAQIGMINAAFYLMAGLLSLPSGVFSDLFGRKQLAILGSFILFGSMCLLYFGQSFNQLAGFYLLLGAGIGAFGPTMMTMVAEITPFSHLGRAYGWYTTAMLCGLGIGPAAGGAMGKWLGLRPVFLIGAGFVGITIYLLQRYLPVMETGSDLQKGKRLWGSEIRNVYTNWPLIGCWVIAFGAFTVSGVFFTFLPLYAIERGFDVGQIGTIFFVHSVANALSRIPIGSFSDRVGHRKYQASVGIGIVSLSIAGFAPARTYPQFVAAALLLGVSMAVAFTSIGALIAETVAPRFRGVAMGGYNACIYFGLMSGSIGFGPLIDAVGFSNGFLLTSGISFPCILFFLWSIILHKKGSDK